MPNQKPRALKFGFGPPSRHFEYLCLKTACFKTHGRDFFRSKETQKLAPVHLEKHKYIGFLLRLRVARFTFQQFFQGKLLEEIENAKFRSNEIGNC